MRETAAAGAPTPASPKCKTDAAEPETNAGAERSYRSSLGSSFAATTSSTAEGANGPSNA
jgi:hypothetical protein